MRQAEPPILRMPFVVGTVVVCTQACGGPPGSAHASPNTLHALDFAPPTNGLLEVVAVADGVVGDVFVGAVVMRGDEAGG